MENLNVGLVYRGSYFASTQKWEEVLNGRDYVSSVTLLDINTVSQETLNTYDLLVNTYESYNDPDQIKLRRVVKKK